MIACICQTIPMKISLGSGLSLSCEGRGISLRAPSTILFSVLFLFFYFEMNHSLSKQTRRQASLKSSPLQARRNEVEVCARPLSTRTNCHPEAQHQLNTFTRNFSASRIPIPIMHPCFHPDSGTLFFQVHPIQVENNCSPDALRPVSPTCKPN